jgi:hypothetical protein
MAGRRLFDPANNPIAALDYEIAQEAASALGRAGRALEAALRALEAYDSAAASGRAASQDGDRRERRLLVATASHALWQFIVQREACGLRDARQIMRDYRVPVEVQNRVGSQPLIRGPGAWR